MSTTEERESVVRVDGQHRASASPSVDGVCVVTVRASPRPQNATRDVLAILDAITTVSLVTTQLARDSPIHGSFEVDEVASAGSAPGTILGAAVRFLLNQLRLCAAIARTDAEVVWFFGATAYVLPVLASRLLGRRVVLQTRGDVPLTLRLQWQERVPTAVAAGLAAIVEGLERFDGWLAHCVVTYSPRMAESLDLDPDRPDVSCLGSRYVDLERFRPQVPLEEREQLVGFVGRLDLEKGVDVLAAVAEALPEDVGFAFVGDGPGRDHVERVLAADVESGRVELPGWVDHETVADYVGRFRLLIMPSEPTEGLPATIAEAMACGTPVYATPVAGIPDLVRPGETGFHIDETDPDAMAARIQAILDREDLSEISGRCRSVAEERYSFEAAVARYEAILADC